jgi:hypothetical protein
VSNARSRLVRSVKRLLGLDAIDRRALEAREEAEAESAQRACHDPFRFASWEAFNAHRAGQGREPVRSTSGWLDR